jgi:hypothetical protein
MHTDGFVGCVLNLGGTNIVYNERFIIAIKAIGGEQVS